MKSSGDWLDLEYLDIQTPALSSMYVQTNNNIQYVHRFRVNRSWIIPTIDGRAVFQVVDCAHNNDIRVAVWRPVRLVIGMMVGVGCQL